MTNITVAESFLHLGEKIEYTFGLVHLNYLYNYYELKSQFSICLRPNRYIFLNIAIIEAGCSFLS
jgi:hypothetical protein